MTQHSTDQSPRRITRRRMLFGIALIGGPMVAGAFAGVAIGRLTSPDGRTVAQTHSLRIGYDELESLIDGNELIVFGTLSKLQRQSKLETGPFGTQKEVANETFVIEIDEVLKGSQYVSTSMLAVVHSTKAVVFTSATDDTFVRMDDGEIDVREGTRIAAFLSRSTNRDGSRYWAIVGQPAIAEVTDGERLVFAASPRFVELQSEAGVQPVAGAGDAPFLTTLSEVRELAKNSPDPSFIDPPRESVPPPRAGVTPVKPGFDAPAAD